MKLEKQKLSLWGIIAGMIWIPLFILAVVFKSGTMNHIFWAVAAVAWVAAIVIGILIIVDFVSNRNSEILYLIGGILLLLFPFIGAIVLLIDRLVTK